MKDKERQKQLDAAARLPRVHPDDDVRLDFRQVVIERECLGVERLTDKQVREITRSGYDAFFLKRMHSYSKIGLKTFHQLAAMGRVELTTEYIVFHAFRERLQDDCRRRIAILLLSKMKEAAKLKN